MPQPKKKQSASSANGVRDVLNKGVVLTAERLQEAVDDAVSRGRMTRGDAEDLVQALLSSGRKQTEDLLADIEQLLGRGRKRTSQNADRVRAQADRARRAVGLGSAFPITGYDDLTAAQITSRLSDLEPAELRKVRDYERRHGNRKSVLSAVERALG